MFEHAPRFNLHYEASVDGQNRTIKLPFVTGIFANFSGNSANQSTGVKDRHFANITLENFNDVLASYAPTLTISFPRHHDFEDTVSETISFSSLDDFLPQNIDPRSMSLKAILDDPAFLALEATWRGLFDLVGRVRPDELCKIKIFDVTKKELSESLNVSELTAQNPLVEKTYIETFCRPNGEPFGCFIGDYYFNQQDVDDTIMLSRLARLSQLTFAPFIGGASASIFGLNSFRGFIKEENGSLDWDRSNRTAWQAWQKLRESSASRFLGLTLPRILIRQSYGNTSELNQFLERLEPEDGITAPCYANSAFAMAANMHRSIRETGCVMWIYGASGLIARPDDLEDDLDYVEASISDRQASFLLRKGYITLIPRQGACTATFPSAESVHKYRLHDDIDLSINETLAARLQNSLGACRIMHYLKCLYRDSDVSGIEPHEVERILNDWLSSHVATDPMASEHENLFDDWSLTVGSDPGHQGFLQLSIAVGGPYVYPCSDKSSVIKMETLLSLNSESLIANENRVNLAVDEPFCIWDKNQ